MKLRAAWYLLTRRADLKHAIRFIDAGHYNINSPKMFYGFLAGIAAQDFDLQRIYVDGFRKLVKHPLNELEAMFAQIQDFADKSGIDIFIGVSEDGGEMPHYLKKYV